MTTLSLLYYRRRFSVAWRDDDPPQRVTKLSRHFLISGRSVVIAKPDLRISPRRLEKNAPAIIRHLHIIEMRPAFRSHVDRGAQPDVFVLEPFGPHVAPPVEIIREPLF